MSRSDHKRLTPAVAPRRSGRATDIFHEGEQTMRLVKAHHVAGARITRDWLTNTAVSSARLYWENKLNFFAPKHVAIPAAAAVQEIS
jgi:hypothetical protein